MILHCYRCVCGTKSLRAEFMLKATCGSVFKGMVLFLGAFYLKIGPVPFYGTMGTSEYVYVYVYVYVYIYIYIQLLSWQEVGLRRRKSLVQIPATTERVTCQTVSSPWRKTNKNLHLQSKHRATGPKLVGKTR